MNYLLGLAAIILVVAGVIFFTKDTKDADTEILSPDTQTQEIAREEETESVETSDDKKLDLRGQGLTSVPRSVFDRTDIEVLDLSDNALSGALQAEVRFLKNLHTLNLSGNNFTGVPAEVGQLSRLEVLDLSDNPLTGLPHEIGNLKNLKILDVRGTSYSTQDLEVIRQGLPSDVDIRVN